MNNLSVPCPPMKHNFYYWPLKLLCRGQIAYEYTLQHCVCYYLLLKEMAGESSVMKQQKRKERGARSGS